MKQKLNYLHKISKFQEIFYNHRSYYLFQNDLSIVILTILRVVPYKLRLSGIKIQMNNIENGITIRVIKANSLAAISQPHYFSYKT